MRVSRHPARLSPSAIALWIVSVLAPLASAQPVPSSDRWERFEFEFPAMGVSFRFVAYAPSRKIADEAFEAAAKRVEELDGIFSDYKSDSEAKRLVAQAFGRPTVVSDDLWRVLGSSQQVWRESDGAFDVTVGPLTRLWRLARKRHRLPESTQVQAAREAVGFSRLELIEPDKVVIHSPNMQLDFGGIAKGYAADECLAIFRDKGLDAAFVDASGDIALGAPPPGETGWRIGITDIDAAKLADRSICLSRCGVATSSDGLQFLDLDGTRYSHIIDPRTGQALTLHSSVTVVAASATSADAWASALSVLGAQRGIEIADRRGDLQAVIAVQSDANRPPTIAQTGGFQMLVEGRTP